MKYTIELTNKQKAQMDCIIDIVHRYVGFNPKLEPIKATNVEDTSEYQIGYKVGFEDGNKIADKDLKEIQDSTYDVAYNEGLKDAEMASRYFNDTNKELLSIPKKVSLWKEEKKKAEEVENYHILVDTLRTVTEEYPKETIVSALSEFGFEVDKLRGEE